METCNTKCDAFKLTAQLKDKSKSVRKIINFFLDQWWKTWNVNLWWLMGLDILYGRSLQDSPAHPPTGWKIGSKAELQNEVLVYGGLRSCSTVSGPRLMCSWAECSLHAYSNHFFRCRDSAWLVFVSSSIDPPCPVLWWIQSRCELQLRLKLLSPTPEDLSVC